MHPAEAARGTTHYRRFRGIGAATLTAFAAVTVAAAYLSTPGILRNALVALWLGLVTGVAVVVVRSSGEREEWLVRARYIGGVAVAVLIVALVVSDAEMREGLLTFSGESDFRPAAALFLIGLAILCLGLLGPAAEEVLRRASGNGSAAVLLSLPVVLLAFLSVAVAGVAQVESLDDTPFGYVFGLLAVALVAGSCVGAVRSSGVLRMTRPVAVLAMVVLAGLAVTWPFGPDVVSGLLVHLADYRGWPLSLWHALGVVLLGIVPSFTLAMRAAAPASRPLSYPRAGTIFALAAASTLLITVFAIPPNSVAPHPLSIVTVPYLARVELLNENWVVSEQITIDEDARRELRRLVDPALVDRAAAHGSTSWWRSYDGSFQEIVVAVSRDSQDAPGVTEQLVSGLGITRDEAACIVAGCGRADQVVDRLREQEIERRMAAEGWPLAQFVDGDPVFVYSGQRSVPTRLPSIASTTDVIGLSTVRLGTYLLTPRAHSIVEIEAPTALVVETFPPISSRANLLIRRDEQIRVELVTDGTAEVRLAMVGWVLQSRPGHWVYAATRWPLLPYALALLVVFALGLLKDRLTERVMAIAGRRSNPRRRKAGRKSPRRRGKRR